MTVYRIDYYCTTDGEDHTSHLSAEGYTDAAEKFLETHPVSHFITAIGPSLPLD